MFKRDFFFFCVALLHCMKMGKEGRKERKKTCMQKQFPKFQNKIQKKKKLLIILKRYFYSGIIICPRIPSLSNTYTGKANTGSIAQWFTPSILILSVSRYSSIESPAIPKKVWKTSGSFPGRSLIPPFSLSFQG